MCGLKLLAWCITIPYVQSERGPADYLVPILTTVTENQGYSQLIYNITNQLIQLEAGKDAPREALTSAVLRLEEHVTRLQTDIVKHAAIWEDRINYLSMQLNETLGQDSHAYISHMHMLVNILSYCALTVLILLILVGLTFIILISHIVVGSPHSSIMRFLTKYVHQKMPVFSDAQSVGSNEF